MHFKDVLNSNKALSYIKVAKPGNSNDLNSYINNVIFNK